MNTRRKFFSLAGIAALFGFGAATTASAEGACIGIANTAGGLRGSGTIDAARMVWPRDIWVEDGGDVLRVKAALGDLSFTVVECEKAVLVQYPDDFIGIRISAAGPSSHVPIGDASMAFAQKGGAA